MLIKLILTSIKIKKYIESSESDRIHKEDSILISNLWFCKKKIDESNSSQKIKIKSVKNKSSTKIYYLDPSFYLQ